MLSDGNAQAWIKRGGKKKRKDEEMDPFVVAFQVSRGGRTAPVLSSRVIAAYC